MSFTKEELAAAGYRLDDGLCSWSLEDIDGCDTAWEYREKSVFAMRQREALVRLAIAHPERAALALGKGWKVQNADTRGTERILWCGKWDGGQAHILTDRRGVYAIEAYGVPVPEQPLVPAIQRAYRIVAAWQRIREAEEREKQ